MLKHPVEFVKGLQHVQYETVLQQLCLFSLTHRRFCGDLSSYMAFWNSPLSLFSTIQPVEGYAATPISSTNHRHQRAYSVCAVLF